MKKMVLSALLLTVLSSAFAIDKNMISVVSDSNAVFKIYYSKPVETRVKIAIYNEEGERVFQEVIRNREGFVRPYNMKELPNGVYTFEISDNNEVKRFDFNYGNIEPVEDETSQIYVNITRLDQGRFLLAMDNAGHEKISIRIFGKSNELIYSESEMVEKQFAQLYNLKSISSESVTFKVFRGNDVIKEVDF